MSKATELDYLLDLREYTEKEMSQLSHRIADLPTGPEYKETYDIMAGAYWAAKARLDYINDSIDSCHAYIQQFGE